jgi:hypothetical protein
MSVALSSLLIAASTLSVPRIFFSYYAKLIVVVTPFVCGENNLCNDEVLVKPELKNALITVYASEVLGATTNYLDAMST